MTFGELIDKLADQGLKVLDKSQIAAPRLKMDKNVTKAPAKESTEASSKKSAQESSKELSNKSAEQLSAQSSKQSTSRYIPAAVNRYIWKRDKSCQICGSDYALQVDHVVPVAMGRGSIAENLRLLCSSADIAINGLR